MVQLVDSDIKTREVLGWKGVHVLHFGGSSCSQKLRVFLNLKGIPWESHPVDLFHNENFRPIRQAMMDYQAGKFGGLRP